MLNICEDNSAAECWSKIIFLSDSIHKLFCAAFGRFKAEHVLTVFHLALALLANTRSHVALASSHVDGQALPPCPPGGAMSQRWAEPQRQQVGAAASVLTPHTLPARIHLSTISLLRFIKGRYLWLSSRQGWGSPVSNSAARSLSKPSPNLSHLSPP